MTIYLGATTAAASAAARAAAAAAAHANAAAATSSETLDETNRCFTQHNGFYPIQPRANHLQFLLSFLYSYF
jgi:hypothetical protein